MVRVCACGGLTLVADLTRFDSSRFCRGGTKLSGVGRDNGEAGFAGYLEPKQVVEWIAPETLAWYHIPSKL